VVQVVEAKEKKSEGRTFTVRFQDSENKGMAPMAKEVSKDYLGICRSES